MPDDLKIHNLSFDGGRRQLAAAMVLFFFLFLVPAYLHNKSVNNNVTAVPETYTRAALQQNGLDTGKVAGAFTESTDIAASNTDLSSNSDNAAAGIKNTNLQANSGKYVLIPLINFRFDKTLNEPASISLVLGAVFLILSLILGWILALGFNKQPAEK